MSTRSSFFIASILLLSLTLIIGDSIDLNASAAVDCEVDSGEIVWNETIARHGLTPEITNDWRDEDDGRGKNKRRQSSSQQNSEDSWLWDTNRQPVEQLTKDAFASISVENDTSGSLRFNLSKGYRYTFCINISQPLGSSGDADVYLLTASDYDTYRTDYAVNHMEEKWWGDDDLSSIPPEWRSFNSIAGWNSFRDSHDYEHKSEVTFSVTIDEDLIWTPLFSNELTWEEFYLVIDKWDNSRADDSQPDGVDALVDISVVVEERGFVLPPWTVSLTCLVLLFAIGAVPVVLNSRYMKAGLTYGAKSNSLVPQLNTEEE